MYQQCPLNAKLDDYSDVNLMYIACQNAHPEAVAWLLEKGMKANKAYGCDNYPLFLLARNGFSCGYRPRKGDIYRTAQILLDAGANVQRRDSLGWFCYHYAAREGNEEFLRALADRGIRLSKTDREGNTGLHIIAEAFYNPLEDLERVKRQMEEKRNEGALPVKLRSPVSMEELEQQKKEIEEKMDALCRCAVILMDAGVDPETENSMLLVTAHTLAVQRGAKKLAAILDGSYTPEEENSPEGQEKIAVGGMTLHQAVRKGDAVAVRTLAARGEDLNAISDQETFEGLSPLAVACQTCDIPMATLLLELGADPTQKNGVGEQPITALFGQQITLHAPKNLYRDKLAEQLVELLVRYGFDLDSSLNDQNDCILGLACASPNGRGIGRDSVSDMVVEKAIELGADVDCKNNAGQTPLMLSCKGDFQTMEDVQTALLEAGADITLRDTQGNTALHYAAYWASRADAVAMTELMLDFGEPDANALNVSGKTAMDYAVERDNTSLVKLLLPYME